MLLKWLFRLFTSVHVALYRLTGGRIGGSMRRGGILLLTTVGRKTGKKRTIPLGYITDDGNYVIVGSNAGLNQHPAWYFNLQNHPKVMLQINADEIPANAKIPDPEEYKRLWTKLIAILPGYANYQKRTTREIPLVILQPER
jgi:F420H(2)-dependent quinone reductase